jgi:transcriptional regulator with XRE-family HTH domain
MKGLRQTRIDRGLSRQQVSDMTGITIANQSLVERGVSCPDLTTRVKFEEFYGVKINWLDTESIDSEPRQFPVTWNDVEREGRYFLHSVASLPIEERKDFIQSVIKHLNKLKK